MTGNKITKVYTYQVTMTVHLIADSDEIAKNQLDDKGGIVTKREVELLNAVPLYGEIEEN